MITIHRSQRRFAAAVAIVLVLIASSSTLVRGQKQKPLPPMLTRRGESALFLSREAIYSHDGTGNNIDNPLLGAAGQPRIRSHPPLNGYVDGLSEPSGVASGLPSAWRVMTELFRTAPPHKDKDVSQLLLFFGQFVSHDVTRSSPSNESMPIPCDHKIPADGHKAEGNVGTSNGAFCPMGAQEMPFQRTQWTTSNSTSSSKGKVRRASINFSSSYIDLDHLYGTDENDMLLRTGVGGRMALDEHGIPPRNSAGHFALGDDPGSRSSPGIFVVAVAFLRYHNLVADALHESNPALHDDELYQAARMKTVAVYQSIVEEAYIPTILGNALDPYEGYDESVDPSIDVFFSTCSFRYGHSGISGLVRLLDPSLRPMGRDPVLLRDAFLNVEGVVDNLVGDGVAKDAVAPIVRGLAANPAKAIDASFVDDFNVFTAAIPVRNIQRGRDNGLPAYNDAREWFDLRRIKTMEELSGGDPAVAKALRGLYGDSVNNVDAYVGALLEAPADGQEMGPLMTASIKDQFTRLRDGDRLWYKALYSQEQIAELPTMSEMLKAVFGEDEMRAFPSDSFAALSVAADSGQCEPEPKLNLLGGSYTLAWALHRQKTRFIDVTVTIDEMIDGGFIGIGWGSQIMLGAEMWFCINSANAMRKKSSRCSPPSHDAYVGINSTDDEQSFSCCVAPGKAHRRPICAREGDDLYYSLDVIDSCLSDGISTATIRAPVCGPNDKDGGNCLRVPDTGREFTAAYSPSSYTEAHGFSRRTSGHVGLTGGSVRVATAPQSNSAFFALHGAAMMLCWLVLAPAAVYIVRYLKGKSWRLMAHIALVWLCGSLAGSLIFAAILSVENAPPSEHKIFGLSICFVYGFQLFTGELRYTREISTLVKSRLLDRAVFISHRFGGVVIIFLSWWNCYIGLVRIGPEDSYVGVTVFNSFPLGYDVKDFGLLRRYIFFPYISVVGLIFLATEARMRYKGGSKHTKRMEEVSKGMASIWGDGSDKDELDTMTIETFLDLTRNGKEFCIVDGRVLDISNFVNVHPGGMRVLRFAVGSDITENILGQDGVDGFRHVHSPLALRTMRNFVKAKLDVPKNPVAPLHGSNMANGGASQRNVGKLFFQKALIVDFTYVTEVKHIEYKPVVRMCLSLPRTKRRVRHATLIPGSGFIFRGRDASGEVLERHYTPVSCFNRDEEEESVADSGGALPSHRIPCSKQPSKGEEDVYEFFISLIPGGRMSSFLMQKKPGSHIMVQGVNVNSRIVDKLHSQKWTDLFLVAAGTGIAPMLPLIDYILDTMAVNDSDDSAPPKSYHDKRDIGEAHCYDRPKIFLAWVVKDLPYRFDDAAGLLERAIRSRGTFKWVTIYDRGTDLNRTPKQVVVQGLSSDNRKNSVRPIMKFFKKFSMRGQRQMSVDSLRKKSSTTDLMDSRLKSRLGNYPSQLSRRSVGTMQSLWAVNEESLEGSEELDDSKVDDIVELNPARPQNDETEAQKNVRSMKFATMHNSVDRNRTDLFSKSRSLAKGRITRKETSGTFPSSPCVSDDGSSGQGNGEYFARRLDKAFIAELLALATGMDCTKSPMRLTSIYKSATDMQVTVDDGEVEDKGVDPNILVAISGRPTFEEQIIRDLKRLRLCTEQIITFQGFHG